MEKFQKIKENLEKEGYRIIGKNSAVKICRWTKKSLTEQGTCYKEKFYGINSHRCCQITPSLFNCQNQCLHCWRNLEYTISESVKHPDTPQEIIEGCIKAQRKLLNGIKGYEKTNQKKYEESQNPSQFAISLIGEPTLYPHLAELILELRKQNKTSFLVTNGLLPEKLKELKEKNALPTQLYVSMVYPNEKLFYKITQNKTENSWKKYNETLSLLKTLKTRTVIRMTLIKDLNMADSMLKDYAELIKKTDCDFIEVKGYMSVGFARERLEYKRMPFHKDIKEFSRKLLKHLQEYSFLDEKVESRVVLLGKDKKIMKIKKNEI